MDSPSVLGSLSKERNISLEEMYISYPRSATILAAACAVIFSVVGVTGNLVTALALLRCRKLRKHATTAFVISLSVSDLLFSAINLPLTASRYVSEAWVLGPTLCKLFPFFFYGNVAVSLLSMVAITINSSVAAHKSTIIPTSAQICQNREDFRLTWMMLIIFCCFLLCFLPLMLVNVIDDEVNLPTLHVLSSVLAWASSVINPFIYAGSNKQYRTAYKKLFCNYKDHPELFIEKQVDVRFNHLSDSHSDSGNTFIIGLQYNATTEKVNVSRSNARK